MSGGGYEIIKYGVQISLQDPFPFTHYLLPLQSEDGNIFSTRWRGGVEGPRREVMSGGGYEIIKYGVQISLQCPFPFTHYLLPFTHYLLPPLSVDGNFFYAPLMENGGVEGSLLNLHNSIIFPYDWHLYLSF